MRIELERQGGFAYFPGHQLKVDIDTADLQPEEASRLEELVDRSPLFESQLPDDSPRPGAADARYYILRVGDQRRQRQIRLEEPIDDPAFADLIDELVRLASG